MDYYIRFITNFLISAGALIMVFNIKNFQDTIHILKNISQNEFEKLKRFLWVHNSLIVSFLAGYLIVLYAVNATDISIGNLFVGIIFLLGALFVLLGIILKKKMIRSMGALYQDSLTVNEKLIQNQDHTTHVLNSLPSVIMGLDSHGCCTMWNYMAEKVTSVSCDHALGNHFASLIPELSGFKSNIDQVMNGSKKSFENKLGLKEDGVERVFSIVITPLKTFDNDGVVIRLDDITEKRLMEKQIVRSEKMISIGGLAAGMAHEINNPLAGMMQNAQLISNRLTKELPANDEAAREFGVSMPAITRFMERRGILKQLEHINHAGIRVTKIIRNMLNFARSNPGDTSTQENDLSDLIDTTIELARNDYDLKKKLDFVHIKISREYCPDLPLIRCDRTKIQQVLFNLIKNASESMAMARDKKPELIFRIKKYPELLQIEVEDNGPGMDEQTRHRIFEPFFTTKEVNKGTGLGLSVSYYIIVDDHGGDMLVKSFPGRGANFIIKLPIAMTQNKETLHVDT